MKQWSKNLLNREIAAEKRQMVRGGTNPSRYREPIKIDYKEEGVVPRPREKELKTVLY